MVTNFTYNCSDTCHFCDGSSSSKPNLLGPAKVKITDSDAGLVAGTAAYLGEGGVEGVLVNAASAYEGVGIGDSSEGSVCGATDM